MQSVTLTAGNLISFDWNFVTNEPPPAATYTYNIAASGDYRLIFGVVDVQDGNYTSALLLDNVVVPEPSTALLLASGLAALAVGRRRRAP